MTSLHDKALNYEEKENEGEGEDEEMVENDTILLNGKKIMANI